VLTALYLVVVVLTALYSLVLGGGVDSVVLTCT